VPLEHAELFSVGCDHALVTFTSDADATAVTRIGDREVETVGPRHVARLEGLEPDTEYPLTVDGVAPDPALPARFRTLARPPGRLLATIATANDVHFGETECGHLGPPHEDIGPFFASAPGEPPYPELMNGAVIDEVQALEPDAVVVKGDLTERGTHDAMLDPTLAIEGAPYTVDLHGVTLAVLDTVIPGRVGGEIAVDQLQWLDDLAEETAGPVLVFGHHDVWPIDAPLRPPDYFGLTPDSSEALVALVGRRENIAGYFAGHTHGNRVYRFPEARGVPFAEVACTKDYPGAWAEYRVYEGGYTHEVHRVTAPAAFDWAEQTRAMFLGLYGELARGELTARCFAQQF
jgi:hypothetical protein